VIEKEGVRSLKEFILGKLYPHSVRITGIRVGDVVRMPFKYDDKCCPEEKKGLTEVMWGEVSALLSRGEIQTKSIQRKDTKISGMVRADAMAQIFGFKSAEEEAQARGLKP
jgi:hypothetical protein